MREKKSQNTVKKVTILTLRYDKAKDLAKWKSYFTNLDFPEMAGDFPY